MLKTANVHETVKVIKYQGLHYPNYCSQCDSEIHVWAVVSPLLKAIFCSDSCASKWFAHRCETITGIKGPVS